MNDSERIRHLEKMIDSLKAENKRLRINTLSSDKKMEYIDSLLQALQAARLGKSVMLVPLLEKLINERNQLEILYSGLQIDMSELIKDHQRLKNITEHFA